MLRSAPLDAPAQHCHRHSNTNDQCRCTCLPIGRRHGQAQRTKRPPRRPNTKSLHEGSDPLPSTKQVRICNGTASNTSCAAVSLRTVPQKLNDSPSNVAIRRQEQEQDPGSSSSAMREHPTVTPQAPESCLHRVELALSFGGMPCGGEISGKFRNQDPEENV